MTAPDAATVELERWGVIWPRNHVGEPTFAQFADGYWTPWHLASAAVERVIAERDDALGKAVHTLELRAVGNRISVLANGFAIPYLTLVLDESDKFAKANILHLQQGDFTDWKARAERAEAKGRESLSRALIAEVKQESAEAERDALKGLLQSAYDRTCGCCDCIRMGATDLADAIEAALDAPTPPAPVPPPPAD